ncbi:leucine-rich repeat-containing protein 27-like [Onthophagus taurus]|uniref:leucine-rich repeat-containing protein 27-like n=1 Tax=Onthophagus taurus TaxID=166361 RepID=UPI0039BDA608
MASKIDVIYDGSQRNLSEVPRDLLELCNLQMLYLENNAIEYLPENIFQKLPRLTWLDLRNNRLKEIPSGVANHQCLDTILLEDNMLERLPNELGLCPNLLVLQVQGNPLVYPHKEILEKGALATCEYLKTQFEQKSNLHTSSELSLPSSTTAHHSQPLRRFANRKTITIQELLRKAAMAAKMMRNDNPVITVKGLSPKNSISTSIPTKPKPTPIEEPLEFRVKKKPVKFCPKASVSNAYYNSNKYLNVRKAKPNKERVIDQQIKDLWMEKLKEILEQQEQLLQQERNLKALKSWRFQKNMEPIRNTERPKLEVPYDTDPDYDKMIQREDLYKQVDTIVRKRRRFSKNVDMTKMISELVAQLKELEAQNEEAKERKELERSNVPLEGESTDNGAEMRAYELARAENEIRKILDLHKKVTNLQSMNDTAP